MTSRALSANLKRQLFTPWRDKDIRALLTVDHSTFGVPYRFVSGDPREFALLVSNGETFQTFPFELTLLSDDDQEPRATLRIQNVDDRIGSTLLNLPDEAVTIMLQIVMTETPDTIEYEATNMELVDVEVTAMAITGRIVMRGAVTEPCPGRVLTSKISPVFFR
jgi:hypothetical protein